MGFADPQMRFHEPLPGTFLLLTWSFMFPGMTQISFTPATASDANVPTGVIGDGDGPGDIVRDDATTSADADDVYSSDLCLVSS